MSIQLAVCSGDKAAPLEPRVLEEISVAAEAIRLAQRLVDTPPAEMNCDGLVAEAEAVAAALTGVKTTVFRYDELAEGGFGGLEAVGRAAAREGNEPALVVLSHEVEGATHTTAMVGKGIVYDTGGLSLKPSDAMCGMKTDMGGAAGVLAAFGAAVKLGYGQNLHCVLCVAENAIGPAAFRNDDVLRFRNGKTSQVSNTDAEGRLVLADGMAYATEVLAPDTLIDMATLTGAQMVSTGKKHAGIVSDSETLEREAFEAGRSSGDLVFPMLYCPEMMQPLLKSEFADMNNISSDRMNAPSSMAAQFVRNQLPEDWAGEWLHVDIAGPASDKDWRATGYGPALLLKLLERLDARGKL